MIDPKHITPLLSNTTVQRQVGKGPSGSVYLVTKAPDNKKIAVKHISIPANPEKTQALIYSGAVRSEYEAQRYYSNLVDDLKNELFLVNKVKSAANLHKYRGYQSNQKTLGIGYDLYLLADYDLNLVNYLAKPITKVNAVNLGIDLAAALEQLRSENLMHKDVHPGNVFVDADGHFSLGDLGIVDLADLAYSTIPDAMITAFTAPEVLPADATLSSTMDIYSVGVILYMIYNGNDIPLDKNGHFKNSAARAPEAPAYADLAMSEIILKACAFNPRDRYQTPSELKEALVLYAQRGDVSDDYLVPQPDPTPEELAAIEAEKAAAEAKAKEEAKAAEEAEAAALAAEAVAVTEDTIIVPDVTDADGNEAAADATKVIPTIPMKEPELLTSPDRPEKVSDGALGRLGEDEMIMPANGEISVESFLSEYRKKNGLEIYSMDGSGNITSIPDFGEPEPEEEACIESADSDEPVAAEESSDTDENAPQETAIGVIPGGIQLPAEVLIDDPVITEEVDLDTMMPEEQSPMETQPSIDDLVNAVAAHINSEIPAEAPAKSEAPAAPKAPAQPKATRTRAAAPAATKHTLEYDADEDDEDDDDDDEKSGSGAWKKVLISIIVLLVLAGGAFAFYTFGTDTISTVKANAVSSTSVVVSAESKNNSQMEVVCATPAGEVARAALENGEATFTDLSPNTTYSFTLDSAERKLLLGSKTASTKTNQMTNLNAFSAVSYSATSATLSLRGTGPQPESWLVTLTSDSGETKQVETFGTQFEITELTPETNYSVSIAKGDGDVLGGTTTCSFTTQEYTVLESFEQTELTTNSMSLSWSFTGTAPDVWTVSYEGSDGSSNSRDISGTACTLDGLTAGVTYTLNLTSDSLKESELSKLEIAIPSITVTEVSSNVDEDGNIVVDWSFTGDAKPSEWRISYTYDDTATPSIATSKTNSVTLTDLIPGTTYYIAVIGADTLTVGGNGTTICTSGAAEPYTEYGCRDASLTLYVLEDNPDNLTDPGSVFTTSQHIAFAIEVSYDETEEEKTASTMYVIRNANGLPVHVYESSRNWPGTWTTARHTGDLPDTIDETGSYTLEVYFDGCLMASADFTVE